MKLLILGNSDTSGLFTAGETWTGILASGLEKHGLQVELIERSFVILNPASARHAERHMRELEPDLVILPVGTAMFTVGFVSKRIEALFGKRAARWYRRMESGFDSRTRDRGTVRNRVNVSARGVVRRVVGTRTMSSEQAVTDGFRAVIDMLARIEETQVALIVAAPVGPQHHRPGAAERRRAFLEQVRGAAAAHHFTWIEAEHAYPPAISDLDIKNRDGLHQTPAGHRMLGEYVLARVSESLQVRA